MRCSCGAISRQRSSDVSKSKKKNLITPTAR